jgi:hypothetical protein
MGLPREVVEISSDEDGEESSGKLTVSPGPLGWVAKLGYSSVTVPRKKKGKSAGIQGVKYEDDDCVVLDGDPHRPVAAAGAKVRSARGDGVPDEVEIVAVKGEVYIGFSLLRFFKASSFRFVPYVFCVEMIPLLCGYA